MYYRLQRLQVSSDCLRLQRTKVKEMEARPFQDTYDVDKVQRSWKLFFSCFWRTKSSSMGSIDLGGSRDTHRTKRSYGSLKIRLFRMLSNQDHSVDLVILISTMWKVCQFELVWGRMSQSKFWSMLDYGPVGVVFHQHINKICFYYNFGSDGGVGVMAHHPNYIIFLILSNIRVIRKIKETTISPSFAR